MVTEPSPNPAVVTALRGVAILFLAVVIFVAVSAALAVQPAEATSFAPAAYYHAGTGPQALVVVDVDRDGAADIVTANDDGARLLNGDGRGRFAAPVRVPSSYFTRSVAAADFNADGSPDLVTVDWDGTLTALLGDGLGGFVVASRVTNAGWPPVVGDFNGDARLDVVTTSALLLGDGAGGFSRGDPAPVGPEPGGLATADFNADGRVDLVATNNEMDGAQCTRILLGDGTGHFADAGAYRSYLEPYAVAVGDLNGDGRQDVVTAESLEGSALGALLGNGSGGFTAGPGVGLGDREVIGVTLGDFDGDGRLDTAGAGERAIVVLRGDGRGGFSRGANFPVRRYPRGVAAADLNRDGMLDLVAIDYAHDAVCVLLNGPRVAPVLKGLSPVRGRAGAVVTLVGAHFGARRGAGVVKFGAVTATEYVSWRGTKIKVRVPEATPKGRVKVRVQTVAGRCTPKTFLRL
jgi:FG-GAP-like repeat/IPT/TIG domain